MVPFPGDPHPLVEVDLGDGKDPDRRRPFPWDESGWDRHRLDLIGNPIRARRESPALREGEFRVLEAEADRLSFERRAGDERVSVTLRPREGRVER